MNGEEVQSALWATIRLVEGLGLPYSLMGALTLAVYGKGRATHDVDIMVMPLSADALQKVREKAPGAGFRVDDVWEQYHPDVRDVQVRLMHHGVPVDVMFPRDDHDRETLQRRQHQAVGGAALWVVTREDFILQKLKAGRPRDFDDVIPFFAQLRDELDHDYLSQWARRLGVREELDFLWSESERGQKSEGRS